MNRYEVYKKIVSSIHSGKNILTWIDETNETENKDCFQSFLGFICFEGKKISPFAFKVSGIWNPKLYCSSGNEHNLHIQCYYEHDDGYLEELYYHLKMAEWTNDGIFLVQKKLEKVILSILTGSIPFYFDRDGKLEEIAF